MDRVRSDAVVIAIGPPELLELGGPRVAVGKLKIVFREGTACDRVR
jgi:hypothetical protein